MTSQNSNKFIKFIPSEKSSWLMQKYPFAFLLLCLIAQRAKRKKDELTGLEAGECHIGDHNSIGASRQQYRKALQVLQEMEAISVIETCRSRKSATTEQPPTRKKSTTQTTTVGTKVKLLNSKFWDVNLEVDNHRINHRTTTDPKKINHEQERNRTKEVLRLKETDYNEYNAHDTKSVSSVVVQGSFLSNKLKEDVDCLKAYAIHHGWDISESSLTSWVSKHGTEYIMNQFSMILGNKTLIRNHETWVQTAITKDYYGKERLRQINFKAVCELKKSLNWFSLVIKKQYCLDPETGNDYYFTKPTDELIEILTLKYQQKVEAN